MIYAQSGRSACRFNIGILLLTVTVAYIYLFQEQIEIDGDSTKLARIHHQMSAMLLAENHVCHLAYLGDLVVARSHYFIHVLVSRSILTFARPTWFIIISLSKTIVVFYIHFLKLFQAILS